MGVIRFLSGHFAVGCPGSEAVILLQLARPTAVIHRLIDSMSGNDPMRSVVKYLVARISRREIAGGSGLRRQVRMKYAGAIFASLLFVLMIGVMEFHDADRFGSMVPQGRDIVESIAVETPVDISKEPDCTQIESDFAAKLEQSRSCQVDADCSLTRLECPFECVTSVSASVLDELKREEMSFQQACRRCESSCPQTLAKWRAACVRQRCIVLDRSIEELEKATLELINESG